MSKLRKPPETWDTMDDLIDALKVIHDDLEAGAVKVDEAQAKTRTIGHVLKGLALAHEHGVESKRIKEGDESIPRMRIRSKRAIES